MFVFRHLWFFARGPRVRAHAWVLPCVCWLGACSSTPPLAPVVLPPPGGQVPAHSVPKTPAPGQEVAFYALSLVDRDYRWGGKTPQKGFDCSGLVSHVYREAMGLDLPGNAAHLARQGRQIETTALRPGDLVFFNTLNQPYSHVGVYIGAGRFVHAANEKRGVRVDHLHNRYYASRFNGATTLWD